MKIYVGRWDLLPASYEGINWIERATQRQVLEEIGREIEEYADTHPVEDNRMGVYTPKEFEAEFNYDTKGQFTTETYWIKIF